MNRIQQGKQSSYLNLQSTLERYAPTVKFDEHEAFDRYYQRWLGCVEHIDELSTKQAQADSKGLTKDKKLRRERMAAAALAVANPARSWALESENHVVGQAVAVSRTQIVRASDKDAIDLCQNVYDVTSEASVAAALAPHGVTAAKLKTLQEAIKKFSAAAPKPRERITSRKTITERLEKAFRAADKCLVEGLDLLIEQFEADFPEFVADYKNARAVVAAPATPKPATESITAEGKVIPKAA